MGQSSRLVEDHGISLAELFEEFAALDRDFMSARLAHGGEDAQRHGELQRAGEIHHQYRHRARRIPGEQPGQQASAQAPGHKLVRQIVGSALSAGFQAFRLLDHAHNTVIAVLAQRAGDAHDAVALLHDAARIDRRAGPFGNGYGFPGE